MLADSQSVFYLNLEPLGGGYIHPGVYVKEIDFTILPKTTSNNIDFIGEPDDLHTSRIIRSMKDFKDKFG